MSIVKSKSENFAAMETAGKIQLRDVEVTVAEAELRLRLPEAIAALEEIEKARLVSQETIEFKFSI